MLWIETQSRTLSPNFFIFDRSEFNKTRGFKNVHNQATNVFLLHNLFSIKQVYLTANGTPPKVWEHSTINAFPPTTPSYAVDHCIHRPCTIEHRCCLRIHFLWVPWHSIEWRCDSCLTNILKLYLYLLPTLQPTIFNDLSDAVSWILWTIKRSHKRIALPQHVILAIHAAIEIFFAFGLIRRALIALQVAV